MNEVWLVRGCEGEYEDYHEWTVRAFASEAEAAAFLSLCEKESFRVRGECEGMARYDYSNRDRVVSVHDPRCTGNVAYDTDYAVERVPFGPQADRTPKSCTVEFSREVEVRFDDGGKDKPT